MSIEPPNSWHVICLRRREKGSQPDDCLDHGNSGCRVQLAVRREFRTVYDEALCDLYANLIFNLSMYTGGRLRRSFNHTAHVRRHHDIRIRARDAERSEIFAGITRQLEYNGINCCRGLVVGRAV